METAIEEILELVKKKMQEQGGYSREAYKEYVDETIGYFIEKGKISDEDNTKFILDRLMEVYNDVKDEFSQ